MIRENLFYSKNLFREACCLDLEQDENSRWSSPICCHSGGHRLAIADGACLTLLQSGESDMAELIVQAELEFERALEVLCWAPKDAVPSGTGLLIVGDSGGALHFVTASGVLVYSRKLIQGDPAGAVFQSLQFDIDSGGALLLAVLHSGRVLGLMNLPISVLASMSEVSDPTELAVHARGLQVMQCSLPSQAPLAALVVPKQAGSTSFQMFIIDSAGSARVLELGKRPEGADAWAFHKTSPSGSRSVLILQDVRCQAVMSLCRSADSYKAFLALQSVFLVLTADGRLVVLNLCNGPNATVLASLTPNEKNGIPSEFLSISAFRLEESSRYYVFTVGLGIADRPNIVQEVVLIFTGNGAASTSREVPSGSELPNVLCLVLPLCVHAIQKPDQIVFYGAEHEKLLWPVGHETTATCSRLALVTSKKSTDLKILSYSKEISDSAEALVAGINAVSIAGGAKLPISLADRTCGVAYIMGCVLGHSHGVTQHFNIPESEESFDRVQFTANLFTMLTTLPSTTFPPDIVALVRCVLCYFQKPPTLFISQLLEKATGAIERVFDSGINETVKKEISKLDLFSLFVETARDYVTSWSPSAVLPSMTSCVADEEEIEEERVRSVVAELIHSLDSDPLLMDTTTCSYQVWMSCILSGNLAEANIIIERHFDGRWPDFSIHTLNILLSEMYVVVESAVDTVPELYIAPDDLVYWMEYSLIPELYSRNNVPCIELCCDFLRAQALSLEFAFGTPFEPAMLTNLAVAIARKYCPIYLSRKGAVYSFLIYGAENAANKKALSVPLVELFDALVLQGAVWRTWDDRPSCCDVISYGLDGLVRNRLLDLALEHEEVSAMTDEEFSTLIAEDVKSVLRPLVCQFQGSLDAIILDWINSILGSALIVYSAAQAKSVYSSDRLATVILYSRLVAIASAMEDPNIMASAVLTLWQMSTSSSAGLHAIEGDAEADTAQAISLERLAQLGSDIFVRVSTGRTKDALQESIRLLRLKAIAATYGISNFDVRNTRQLRGVVNIITTSYWMPKSIADGIEFAEAWSSISIDLSYILGRALISRVFIREVVPDSVSATAEEMPPLEPAEKRKLLEDAFKWIPESRLALVMETAISFLVDRLEEVCLLISAGISSENELSALREEASMACNGAVTLGYLYLEGSAPTKNSAATGTRGGSSVLGTAVILTADSSRHTGYINIELLAILKRLRFLQSDYNIFMSVSGLTNPKVCLDMGRRLAEARASDLISGAKLGLQDWSTISGKKGSSRRPDNSLLPSQSNNVQSQCPMLAAKTRHACLLLNVSPVFVEYNVISFLIKEGKMELAMAVAKMLSFENTMESKGVSDKEDNAPSVATNAELVLSAAIALCSLVARQANARGAKSIAEVPVVETFSLTRNMLQMSSVTCSSPYLGNTLDLFSGCDFVVSVYERFETKARTVKGHWNSNKGAGSTTSAVGTFQVSEHISFSRDGILMSPESALMPLLKYVLKEVQRRGLSTPGTKSDVPEITNSLDVEELAIVLQKSENHILAVRSLLSSWCRYGNKIKALQTSLLGLSRKILAYRDIDSCLGVACLASVSYETMVRELKQAVPSIQSDFSRLQTVAVIGEDLSRLWSQEELLGVFQSLQTNAKWWHTLASHGIKIDPRAFQSSVASQREACIRAVVPELLSKSCLNLELAIEYCCQFDVEGSYATLCYIEQLLLTPPISPSELSWMKLVNQASTTVGEAALVNLYKGILRKINPLDYERIRFVTLWLIQVISEDPSLQGENKSDPSWGAIESYNRCVDTISFLSGVSFHLSGGKLTPAYENVYKDFSPSSPYLNRLPIWMLLDDTWSVLGPIMANLPELCSKLTLLCGPLAINSDIFHSKRVMASTGPFPLVADADVIAGSAVLFSTSGGFNSKKNKQGKLNTSGSRFMAVERLKEFQDSVQCIEDPVLRIEVWQWAFFRERNAKNWFVAEIILDAALDDTASFQKITRTDLVDKNHKMKDLRGEMTLDLVKLKCRRALIGLIEEKDREAQENLDIQTVNTIINSLSLQEANNVERIIKRVLEWALEMSWEMQLRHMQGGATVGAMGGIATRTSIGDALTIWDLTISHIFPSVVIFFHRIAEISRKVSSYCSLLDKQIRGDILDDSKSPQSAVESVRHLFITKLLADGHTSYPLSDKSFGSDEKASNSVSSVVPANSSSSVGWAGVLGIGESLVSPTLAAGRRRSDIFCAFSIAVFVGCCGSVEQRKPYLDQLQALAKSGGKSGKARRFTARSKFRAIQALKFLPAASTHVDSDSVSYDWSVEDNDLWSFLYCSSELQELRLPCSEEALGFSLGISLGEGQHIVQDPKLTDSHDPRLLIRTLLRDEGAQSDVSELCRDILLCSGATKAGSEIWEDLLAHMEINGHHRALLDTLILLRRYCAGTSEYSKLRSCGKSAVAISSICKGDLAAPIVRVLNIFTIECVEKIEQLMALVRNRSESDMPSIKQPNTDISSRNEAVLGRNYNRIVLRQSIRGCIWGISDMEEAPEDLLLCIEQLSVLWALCSHFCPRDAFTQLQVPCSGNGGDILECLNNTCMSSFCAIVDAGFSWLSLSDDMTESLNKCPTAWCLEDNLRDSVGFAKAAVLSQIMESCTNCFLSSVSTVLRISCVLHSNQASSNDVGKIASEVLKTIYCRVETASKNIRGPKRLYPVDRGVGIFNWLTLENPSHWPWVLVSAGFLSLSPNSIFSFIDYCCIETENIQLLKILLSAAANAWWQATSISDTDFRGPASTGKVPQLLIQWCLSSRARQLLLSKSFKNIDETTKYRLLLAVEASQAKLLQSKVVDISVLEKLLALLKGAK